MNNADEATSSEANQQLVQERDVLLCKVTNERFRVVHNGVAHIWLMPMDHWQSAWPFSISKKKLAEQLDESYAKCGEDKQRPLSTKAVARAEVLYDRFKDALCDPMKLLTSRGRTELFEIVRTGDSKIREKLFYKIVRLWLVGGGLTSGLAPDWGANRPALTTDGVAAMSYAGAVVAVQRQSMRLRNEGYQPPPDKDHTATGKNRRRGMPISPTNYAVDKNTLRVFLHFTNQHIGKEGSQLKTIYSEMRKEVFSTATATGDFDQWPDFACPSFRQFDHWYRKLTDFRQRSVAKTGEADWNLNNRATPLQGVTPAYAAGAVGSIDATLWAVELVSDDEEAREIGCPIVFRVRCRDFGMPLGLSVTLENASWLTAASAIANCNEDKVKFCASLGIEILPEDWPVRGLPAAFEADCGETHNKKPNTFIALTQTDLRNIQMGRGDLKPGVESDWAVLHLRLSELAPGAIIARYEQKHRAKWRAQARMTLKQFTKMLVLAELKRMHEVRTSLDLPVAMTAAGVAASPISMWNWSLARRGGGLRSFDHDAVRLSLLLVEKGSVTEDGILFRGLLYLADELAVAHAYERARANRRRTLDIAFDDRLVDNVYIVHGDENRPSKYTVCSLNTARVDQSDFRGRTFREVQKIRRRQDATNLETTTSAKPKIDAWTKDQQQLAEEATARVDAIRLATPVSARALDAGRSAARAAERDATSPSQALRPLVDTKHQADSMASPTPANVVPILQRPKRPGGLAARAAALGQHVSPISTNVDLPHD